ncbi:MAG TPA: SCP2 sterol-binding domain-containing protein [Telmatospirillum sp.]|nr:SCP2 sterol-binding domain-containing protein [Telmatospirillum sp.]
MSAGEIDERLQNILPQLKNMSGTIRFDLGVDGRWLVDARTSAACLRPDDGDADVDCTIRISAETLMKMLDGKLDPMLAYTLGKIKVKGSMGLAMKLVSVLG